MDCGRCMEHAAQLVDPIVIVEVVAGGYEADDPAVIGGSVWEATGENMGGALLDSGGYACNVEMIDGPCSSQKWPNANYTVNTLSPTIREPYNNTHAWILQSKRLCFRGSCFGTDIARETSEMKVPRKTVKFVSQLYGQTDQLLGRTSPFGQSLRLDKRMSYRFFYGIGTGTERGWEWRVDICARPIAWPDLRAASQNMQAKLQQKYPFSPFWWDEGTFTTIQYMAPVRFVITRKITLLLCTDAKKCEHERFNAPQHESQR